MAPSDCYDKALDLLAARPHFRRQLEEKLRARRFPSDEIGQTLDRLVESGVVDDDATARGFVEQRLRKSPIGRRRMRFELEQRGAPGDAVAAALDAGYADRGDLDGARLAAERWIARGRRDESALARYLARQGFESGSVVRVLEEWRRRGETDPEG